MDINVTIKCPDLPLAAAVLAKAILREEYPENNPTVPSQDTAPTAPALVNPTTAATLVTTTPGPATTAPMAPAAVPTTPAPQITGDMVAKAGADLIAANPAAFGPLNALLQKYGVPDALHLSAEQIGAFATEMRALGAKI